MTDQHPITPPPELVQQLYGLPQMRAIEAAYQAGADQELEACCEALRVRGAAMQMIEFLRTARRPKPPTLKEQALEALREAESTGCLYVNGRSDLIRKALETLP